MKTTSRFALAAAAGLTIGSWSLSAKAADLGGDCCADLEERVAELEATTVRKGNRKVSLELSGQINRALLSFDDGVKSDAYIVDNGYSSSRFRFKGTGQMLPGWKAGFYYEIETRDSASQLVDNFQNQGASGDSSGARIDFTSFRERQANVFVENERLGRVTLGLQNTAAKEIAIINLGGSLVDSNNYFVNSFYVRDKALGTSSLLPLGNGGSNGNVTARSTVTWGALSNSFDTTRLRGARYDTPSIYGFIGSAFWGENDFFDAALRYQKEWNSIRIAAGVGYYYDGDPNRVEGSGSPGLIDTGRLGGNYGAGSDSPVRGVNLAGGGNSKIEVVSGSVSALHIPTGLYANFGAGTRHIDNPAAGLGFVSNNDAQFYYGQAGITKRFLDVGATTIYGEYGNYDKFGNGYTYTGSGFGAGVGANAPGQRITDSSADKWGFGAVQAFDSAALELYANYEHYSADLTVGNISAAGVVTNARTTSPEDIDVVVTGARIKF